MKNYIKAGGLLILTLLVSILLGLVVLVVTVSVISYPEYVLVGLSVGLLCASYIFILELVKDREKYNKQRVKDEI